MAAPAAESDGDAGGGPAEVGGRGVHAVALRGEGPATASSAGAHSLSGKSMHNPASLTLLPSVPPYNHFSPIYIPTNTIVP